MATKKVSVELDIESNAKGSIDQLRELRKELRGAAAGSEEFNRISAEIRNVEDALKNAALEANDFRGQLEAAPGPVGQLFAGLKKVEIATKSWGAALKATGIGLIVAAVAGLVMAFREQEDAMKKLEPILIAFEQIFNGIFDAIEPLIDMFLELVMQILPPLTQGMGIFYSILLGLFNLVKSVGVGVGQILKGIFTLDTAALKEGWETLKTAIPEAIDAGLEAYERFEAGTERLTSTQRKNAEERNKLQEDETRKLEEELRKREEAQRKANQIFLLNLEDEQREYIQALERRTERERILREAGYTDLTVAEELYRKEIAEIAEKYDKIEQDRLARIAADEERRRLELERAAQEEEDRLRKAAEAALEIERLKAQGIFEINQSMVDNVSQLGNLLQNAAVKNRGIAIAGVIIEQAAAIAKIVQATATANALTTARWAAIPGGPAIAARQIARNNVAAGLGIASSITAGARAISQMRSVNFSTGGGGGNASGGRSGLYTPPAPPTVESPSLSPSVGIDATSQIAQTLQTVSARPVRAYVISSEVSSQQALDRRTRSAATFG
jgi:hypothetical protein